jgi:hypothetical protein
MAYGRSSNGGRLLNDWNISTNYVISFVHDCEWRLGDCGLDKNSPRVEGMSEGGTTYPSPVLLVGVFWIDSI